MLRQLYHGFRREVNARVSGHVVEDDRQRGAFGQLNEVPPHRLGVHFGGVIAGCIESALLIAASPIITILTRCTFLHQKDKLEKHPFSGESSILD